MRLSPTVGMPAAKRVLLTGKSEAERASLSERGVDADLPAVTLHHALRQVETVSRPASARLVELQAEVENLGRVAGVDSDSVIANAEAVRASFLIALDGDCALALGAVVEEERIGDQRADGFAH